MKTVVTDGLESGADKHVEFSLRYTSAGHAIMDLGAVVSLALRTHGRGLANRVLSVRNYSRYQPLSHLKQFGDSSGAIPSPSFSS